MHLNAEFGASLDIFISSGSLLGLYRGRDGGDTRYKLVYSLENWTIM